MGQVLHPAQADPETVRFKARKLGDGRSSQSVTGYSRAAFARSHGKRTSARRQIGDTYFGPTRGEHELRERLGT